MSRTVKIARCPEHGLHGERDTCFVCNGPVEQVEMREVKKPKRTGVQHPGRIKATIEQLTEGVLPSIESKYKTAHVYSFSKKWRPPSGRGSSEVSDPTGNTYVDSQPARDVLERVGGRLVELLEEAKSIEGEVFALVRGPGTSRGGEDIIADDEKEEAELRRDIRDLEDIVAELNQKQRAAKAQITSKLERAKKLAEQRDRREREDELRKRRAATRLRRIS